MPKATVNFNVAGARLTIETGITPVGEVKGLKTQDIFEDFRDSKGNLIRSCVYGLDKLARSGRDKVLAQWGADDVKPKSGNKPDGSKGKKK